MLVGLKGLLLLSGNESFRHAPVAKPDGLEVLSLSPSSDRRRDMRQRDKVIEIRQGRITWTQTICRLCSRLFHLHSDDF